MKRLLYIIILSAAVIAGCSKADELLYTDMARIQLADTSALNSTFVYENSSVNKDTVYVEVSTIGRTSDHDRPVKLVQVKEEGDVNEAIPGVHYVALDDPSLESTMVVKAGAVTAQLPVVLIRDASLKEKSFRLRVELVENESFGLGELQRRSRVIIFSDRLERFYSWRVNSGTAPAFYSFGNYSTRKHQFMVDNLHEQIDEAWYQRAVAAGALQNYKNLLKQLLNTFNNDPAHIASGEAPLRETSEPGSPLITFPN